MKLCELTITQAHKGLVEKEFSASELVKSFLEKIEKNDKEISAFLTVTEKQALLEAKSIDNKIAAGEEISELSGIPFAVKDNILVKGIKTTCASKILSDYIAPYDATCIRKLKRLGAIILGKTNLDEFAMGGSTENSAFFTTKNPYDLERVAGGSSGGSAAAVASNMSIFALGSDTGGSIRQPSSFCGVVGLKPTYGAVSRYGLVAFASSLDQIGVIAKTVDGAKIVFKSIQGRDRLDSTSIKSKISNFPRHLFKKIEGGLPPTAGQFPISDFRIGIPKEYFIKGIDSGVENLIKKTIKKYEEMGVKIEEISLPHTKYALSAYYLIATSEASANLARYDGIRYGFSNNEAESLLGVYLKSRENGFGREVKRRIMLGTYALSAGYYDAYYLKAGKVRTLIKEDFNKAFEKVDVILTPTTPTPAFKIGEKTKDPLSMYLADIFTVSVNLAGLPAVSVPVGFTNNLPVGLQIIGKPFEEDIILEIGNLVFR